MDAKNNNLNICGETKRDELSSGEILRYERQMLLPRVGQEGQLKLKNAKVLIIGAGGLGSPASLYMAGAGVGTVGIVDMDVVDISNLHRQILHDTASLGHFKEESAAARLKALNPDINIVSYNMEVTGENIAGLIAEYDFIVDAVDSFKGKFLINDACVAAGKPFCHGGVLGFSGQVLTYVPGKGPCYRCIFGEEPEKGAVPTCREAGILGPVAGIIGSIQAMETVKYLLGMDGLLVGKMFIMDGRTMETRIAEFPKKNPGCKACGKSSII